MSRPSTELIMAATNEAPNVRAYAALARSVQTAARNCSQESSAAVTTHAPSGMSTSTLRYR